MSAVPILSDAHLLLFVAGLLAGVALVLLVRCAQDTLFIVRYIRNRRRHPFADLAPDIRPYYEATHERMVRRNRRHP